MPLPPSTAERTRLHQRRVSFDGFKRADGLWDLEGHLVDSKDHDYPLSTGVRRPDEAVHEMWVRVTIDRQMNIHAAISCTDAAPYLGACDSTLADYSKIVGLNLFQGFLKTVKEMFGGVRGCTHVSELLMFLPTVALQTFASEMVDNDESDHQPYHLDRCHALALDSETVRRYYPRWYRPAAATPANPAETLSSSASKDGA